MNQLFKFLVPIIRGVVKGGSFGTATPIIEFVKNVIHKNKTVPTVRPDAKKLPHDYKSIVAQIVAAAYVLFGTEPGKVFIREVLKSFGITF